MATRKTDEFVARIEDGEDAGEEFDLAKLKRVLGFFLRAPRRHPVLAGTLALVTLGIAFSLAAWLPRIYTADLRVIAHRSIVLQPHDGAAPLPEPTVGVSDEIMKRDNLITLIKELDLVNRWDATRPPMLRFKDSIVNLVRGPLTEENRLRTVLGVLDQRLSVWVDQNAITVTVDWPNPQIAYELVNTAYKNFLDSRYRSEVSIYSERLRLLEMRAQFSAHDVDLAIEELTKLERDRRNAATPAADTSQQANGRAPSFGPPRPAATPGGPDMSASDDTTHALEAVRTQIRTREEESRRRIAEADSQLADAEASLGPLHPTVLALKRKSEVLRESPPELEALREHERQLVGSLAAITQQLAQGNPADPNAAAGQAPRPPIPTAPPAAATPGPSSGMTSMLEAVLSNRDDPSTAYARSKLQSVSQQYIEVLNHLQLAKVELDEAQASFKDTYVIHRPAEVPAKPKKPNVVAIVFLGLVFAFLLALVVPGMRDLLGGRVLEPWQVEAVLKIPILGELYPGDGTGQQPPHDVETAG
jgi:uncharacterized protein involved in exopolysaccharide biosynthesis